MIDELNGAIETYRATWQSLVDARANKQFFENLRPIAVTLKVADETKFDRQFLELKKHCDQMHAGRLDERWLGMGHLRDQKLTWDISVVKIYQRRPNSTDALGLDHVDFLLPEGVDVEAILQAENDLNWSEEHGDYAEWISIWFEGGPEAKLRAPGKTTLDAIISELAAVRDTVSA
jgi:hypothetical protein